MSKGYIVLEVAYEYNDEIYHTGNHGESYSPVHVFTSKQEAQNKKDELERTKWRGLEVYQYTYGLEDILRVEEDELKTQLASIYSNGPTRDKLLTKYQNKLAGTLKGKALTAAVNAAVRAEMEENGEDVPEVDTNELTIPEDLTDAQVDAVRALFDLQFYEIQEIAID